MRNSTQLKLSSEKSESPGADGPPGTAVAAIAAAVLKSSSMLFTEGSVNNQNMALNRSFLSFSLVQEEASDSPDGFYLDRRKFERKSSCSREGSRIRLHDDSSGVGVVGNNNDGSTSLIQREKSHGMVDEHYKNRGISNYLSSSPSLSSSLSCSSDKKLRESESLESHRNHQVEDKSPLLPSSSRSFPSYIMDSLIQQCDYPPVLLPFNEPLREKVYFYKGCTFRSMRHSLRIGSVTLLVLAISILVTALCLFGVLSYQGSGSNRIYYGSDYLGQLKAPFILFSTETMTMKNFNNFGSDLIVAALSFLVFWLQEASLLPIIKSFWRRCFVFGFIMAAVAVSHYGIGFGFSRGTGFACPRLFFSEAMHESSEGIHSFLWCLLVLHFSRFNDRYLVCCRVGEIESHYLVRKVHLQVLLIWLPLIFKCRWWWAVSSLVAGLVLLTVVLLLAPRQRRKNTNGSNFVVSESFIKYLPWSLCDVIKHGWKQLLSILLFSILLLTGCHYMHQPKPHFISLDQVPRLSEGQEYILTFLVMTAPRPGHPLNLIDTIKSYVQHFPPNSSHPLFNRVRMIVYTHFSEHPIFDQAREYFTSDPNSLVSHYIEWRRQPGNTYDQARHFARSIKDVSESVSTRYIAIIEDDFPLCQDKWLSFWTVLHQGTQAIEDSMISTMTTKTTRESTSTPIDSLKSIFNMGSHCAVFVGTGGSGIIFRSELAVKLSELLMKPDAPPTDIVLQNCLRGKTEACQGCKMAVSKTLLMYHTGYNTSTSERVYGRDEFQCGWRHPFNVNVKWNGKKYENIELDVTEPALVFKTQLYALTNVEVERQKIMIKGGMLKDDTDLKSLNIPVGHTFLMMGTAGELPKAPEKPVQFLEDMNEQQLAEVVKMPPGLVNLGNTCYMNATLQCLRAIPELGTSLSRFEGNPSDDVRSGLTSTLKLLFDQLSKTTESVTPVLFLQLLRAVYPQFSQQGAGGIFMQQDAEECYSQLVSNLRDDLKVSSSSSPERKFIDTFMSGSFVSSLKSEEAPNEDPIITSEQFTKLSCHISSAVNYLTDGLNEALVEKIEKNSPTLNRQAVYTKTTKIDRLPKYLTINFVRFFWKPQERIKAKILRKVKFPISLDMYQFCTDDLKKKLDPTRSKIKSIEDDRKSKKVKVEEDEQPISYDLPLNPDFGSNGSGFYELKAVLTHIGRSSDAGHYMAWVRDGETDNWWKFDDDKVSPVKSDDILKLDGGGDWHMAYLLVYGEKTYS